MVRNAQREVSRPVAVVVERRAVDDAWQSYVWSALSVDFDTVGGPAWRVLRSTARSTLYRVGDVPMVLHAKEMTGYRVNFANGEPRVYVALQVRDFDPDMPVSVDLVTASGLEVQAYGNASDSVADNAPMSRDVLDWVQAFIAEQAPETDTFVKRVRDRAPTGEDFKFGNVTMDQLRRDAVRRDPSLPQHPALRGNGRR